MPKSKAIPANMLTALMDGLPEEFEGTIWNYSIIGPSSLEDEPKIYVYLQRTKRSKKMCYEIPFTLDFSLMQDFVISKTCKK